MRLEIDGHLRLTRQQMIVLGSFLLLNRPGTQSHIHPVRRGPRLVQRAPADPLRDVKFSHGQIADREMTEITVAHGPPALLLRGRELNALPEKRELVTEGPP